MGSHFWIDWFIFKLFFLWWVSLSLNLGRFLCSMFVSLIRCFFCVVSFDSFCLPICVNCFLYGFILISLWIRLLPLFWLMN